MIIKKYEWSIKHVWDIRKSLNLQTVGIEEFQAKSYRVFSIKS